MMLLRKKRLGERVCEFFHWEFTAFTVFLLLIGHAVFSDDLLWHSLVFRKKYSRSNVYFLEVAPSDASAPDKAWVQGHICARSNRIRAEAYHLSNLHVVTYGMWKFCALFEKEIWHIECMCCELQDGVWWFFLFFFESLKVPVVSPTEKASVECIYRWNCLNIYIYIYPFVHSLVPVCMSVCGKAVFLRLSRYFFAKNTSVMSSFLNIRFAVAQSGMKNMYIFRRLRRVMLLHLTRLGYRGIFVQSAPDR